MHIEIQNCFSFWGTKSPRPPTGHRTSPTFCTRFTPLLLSLFTIWFCADFVKLDRRETIAKRIQQRIFTVKPHLSRISSGSLAEFFGWLGLNSAKPDFFSASCGLAKLRLASRLKFAAYQSRKGVCGGAKFFGSTLLQPAAVFASPLSAFSIDIWVTKISGEWRKDASNFTLLFPQVVQKQPGWGGKRKH